MNKPLAQWQIDAMQAAFDSALEQGGPGDVRGANLLASVRREDDRERWKIGGVELTREQVMARIIELVYDGNRLTQICKIEGAPRIGTVMRWRERFPSFAADLERAQRALAAVMAEESVDDAVEQDPKKAKVMGESKRWLAAKYDDRFADKQKVDFADMSNLSRQEVEEQLAMLLLNGSKELRQKLDELLNREAKTITLDPTDVSESPGEDVQILDTPEDPDDR